MAGIYLFFIIFTAGVASSDSYQEFSKHGNGNPNYALVNVECERGHRSSGYANTPTGGVFFKQKEHDGTIGDVCKD